MPDIIGKYDASRDEALKNHLSLHNKGGIQEFKDVTITREVVKGRLLKSLEGFGIQIPKK